MPHVKLQCCRALTVICLLSACGTNAGNPFVDFEDDENPEITSNESDRRPDQTDGKSDPSAGGGQEGGPSEIAQSEGNNDGPLARDPITGEPVTEPGSVAAGQTDGETREGGSEVKPDGSSGTVGHATGSLNPPAGASGGSTSGPLPQSRSALLHVLAAAQNCVVSGSITEPVVKPTESGAVITQFTDTDGLPLAYLPDVVFAGQGSDAVVVKSADPYSFVVTASGLYHLGVYIGEALICGVEATYPADALAGQRITLTIRLPKLEELGQGAGGSSMGISGETADPSSGAVSGTAGSGVQLQSSPAGTLPSDVKRPVK